MKYHYKYPQEDFPILSIIVPSFNIERFVDECLPHYADARLLNKIRVFLIDDGATDSTYDRCLKYICDYPEIFQFIHKENGGHGSVINLAVKKYVKTKYFKVVDGDDYVDTDNLCKLCDMLLNCNEDLIVTNYFTFNTNEMVLIKTSTYENSGISTMKLTIHSITYKTDFYKSNSIILREKCFYEDNEYVIFPLFFIQSYRYINIGVYYYRIGNSGQSISLVSRVKHYQDLKNVLDDLIIYYKDNVSKLDVNKVPGIDCVIKRRIARLASDLLILMIYKYKSKKDILMNRISLINFIKENTPDIHGELFRLKRIKVLLFLKHAPLFFVRKIFKKVI